MAFHGGEQQDEAQLRRQLFDGAGEVGLKLAGGSEIFRRWVRHGLRPECFALLATFGRTRAIERQSERDANQPGAKTLTIAQAVEAAVGAQHSFLRDVFRVGGISQHAASNAERQRTAFGEALFEFATVGGAGRFACPFGFRRATWLDQDQLLHWLVCASRMRSPSPYTYQTPRCGNWFTTNSELALASGPHVFAGCSLAVVRGMRLSPHDERRVSERRRRHAGRFSFFLIGALMQGCAAVGTAYLALKPTSCLCRASLRDASGWLGSRWWTVPECDLRSQTIG